MKKILSILLLYFLLISSLNAADWEIKNKWKVSCGIVDNESLVVNGKPKTKFVNGSNIVQSQKNKEFEVKNAFFKLDQGDVGTCKTDKSFSGGYLYSGRQEINHKLPVGRTIFETEIIVEGAPAYRSTFFQIHDGRNSGAPPSWIGIGEDWKIKHNYPKSECSLENCKIIKHLFLRPDIKYKFKADISYRKNDKKVSVRYYLNDELAVQHINVPISKSITDGPYGPNIPYIKIGIYRIGETGTTSYAYNNLIIKNNENEF